MRVLVVTASKYGATTEIGEAIAEVVRRRGHEVSRLAAADVRTLADVDAVVVGSAVYMGRWRRDARELVERHRERLQALPLWLFSSGPIGAPLKPEESSPDGLRLASELRAQGHVTFAGKLDRSRLTRGDRAVVAALRAPDGDFRDWPAVRSWAGEIADALAARPAGV